MATAAPGPRSLVPPPNPTHIIRSRSTAALLRWPPGGEGCTKCEIGPITTSVKMAAARIAVIARVLVVAAYTALLPIGSPPGAAAATVAAVLVWHAMITNAGCRTSRLRPALSTAGLSGDVRLSEPRRRAVSPGQGCIAASAGQADGEPQPVAGRGRRVCQPTERCQAAREARPPIVGHQPEPADMLVRRFAPGRDLHPGYLLRNKLPPIARVGGPGMLRTVRGWRDARSSRDQRIPKMPQTL